MINKPRRNEPCHCGSGKKYKKCCLIKDEAAEKERTAQQYLEPLMNDWDNYSDGDFDEDGDNDFDEGRDVDFDSREIVDEIPEWIKQDSRLEKQIEDEVPEISKEDEKLVDGWWDKYKKMNDPVLERQFLEQFMEAHPELVINLGLHHEMLFELTAAYLKLGKIDDHIQFMMRIRKEFPDSYLKSAGYYDYDIITWLISKNRANEISGYLDVFKKYPIDFVDKLFEVIDLLQAMDLKSDLIDLVMKIYEPVCYSDEVYGGHRILTPLISNIYSGFLKPYYSDDDLDNLIVELEVFANTLAEGVLEQSYWKSIFEFIFRPYSIWEIERPVTKRKINDLHFGMSMNYMRFLKEKTGISYVSANFHSMLIAEYLHSWHMDTKKRNNALFDFSKNVMDRQTAKLSKKMGLFIDATKAMGFFNAIYYFADYLLACGNIDENQASTIQKDCTDMYTELAPHLKAEYIEMLVFKNFPMWG